MNVATEAVERVYQHPFGVNIARGDRRGGIWFTQSTRNGPEHGERDLFRSVDVPTPSAGLRNRLVHEYDEVDPVKLHEACRAATVDVPRYLRSVDTWLSDPGR